MSFANLAIAVAATSHVATGADPLLWYVTRAAAVSGYVTLGATVVLGLFRSLAQVGGRRTSWALDEAHQWLAVLAVGFVALHLLSLALDPLIPFSLLNLVLPLAEPYRPLASDVGVLGLYSLAIVALSSWLRRRIAHATWRALHYVSFATFTLVTAHGLLAGTDAGTPWMRAIYLGASGAVLALVLVRLLRPAAGDKSAQRAASKSMPA